MEFAIAASCLDRFTFKDLLYACTSLAVDGLELSNRDGAQQGTWSPELDHDHVLGLIRAAGQRVTAIAAWTDFVQPSAEALEPQLTHVRQSVDLAIRYHCEIIRVLPGEPKPGIPEREWVPRIAAALREVLPYAEERGLLLALQTHGRVVANAGTALDILEAADSDNLKVTLDPAHFRSRGHDLEATRGCLEELLPHTAHVHLTDGVPGPGGSYHAVSVGEGDAPVELVVSSLLARAFARPLCFRYDGPLDPVEGLRRGIAYLRDLPRRILEEAGLL